jgi:hypothetical protein
MSQAAGGLRVDREDFAEFRCERAALINVTNSEPRICASRIELCTPLARPSQNTCCGVCDGRSATCVPLTILVAIVIITFLNINRGCVTAPLVTARQRPPRGRRAEALPEGREATRRNSVKRAPRADWQPGDGGGPNELWTTAKTAAYLKVPVSTLYAWRYRNSGPPAHRIGRHLRYDAAEVRRWAATQ